MPILAIYLKLRTPCTKIDVDNNQERKKGIHMYSDVRLISKNELTRKQSELEII